MNFFNLTLLLLVMLVALSCSQVATAVTIDWAPVGNPGNAPDTAVMQEDGTTGYGSVGYNYSIARYDVTNSQYAEFLNAKDPDGANLLGLYNSNMSAFPLGGIIFNAMASPGSHYHTSDAGNHPVNDVTWYSAIRFANWMNNGQGNGDTETGSYSLGQLDSNGVPVDGFSITRSAAAHVVLPSEDEWYKAAYYDPRTTAQGGPPADSHYWLYGTSSNTAPTAEAPAGGSNSANYDNVVGNFTNVGAYTTTMSPSGAFDMSGNIYQWNEGVMGLARVLRGGSFFGDSDSLMSTERNGRGAPTTEGDGIGFRLALVPEPSGFGLAVLAILAQAGLAGYRRALKPDSLTKRRRSMTSTSLKWLFLISMLALSTTPANASEIDITIDESLGGPTPTVTAVGLSSQSITVQTLGPESWQIDITGDAPAAWGGYFSHVTFLELSEPGLPDQVSDILTLTSLGGDPNFRTTHLGFSLQSDDGQNPLSSIGPSQTELATGNTITFGEFLTGTGGAPTIPLNVTVISDVQNLPEPSTGLLAMLAAGMTWWWRKRFKLPLAVIAAKRDDANSKRQLP